MLSQSINTKASFFSFNNDNDFSRSIISIFPTYHLHQKFIASKMSEDSIIQDVEIYNRIEQLNSKMIYLYIITKEGQIWFSPRTKNPGNLAITHAALLRKAMSYSGSNNNDQVIASGEIAIDLIKRNSIYINLSSGHFEPKIKAYTPAMQVLEPLSGSRTLFLQARHENSLDASTAVEYYKSTCIELKYFINGLLNQIKNLEVINVMDNEELNPAEQKLKNDAQELINVIKKVIHSSQNLTETNIFTTIDCQLICENTALFELINNNLNYCSNELEDLINEYTQKKSVNLTPIL
jgi:hypothetical protein